MSHPDCALDVCEIRDPFSPQLASSFALVAADFLTFVPEAEQRYDRIVMNPPFSRQRDIARVMHAWECLAPGGHVVAAMAAGASFRKDAVAK